MIESTVLYYYSSSSSTSMARRDQARQTRAPKLWSRVYKKKVLACLFESLESSGSSEIVLLLYTAFVCSWDEPGSESVVSYQEPDISFDKV